MNNISWSRNCLGILLLFASIVHAQNVINTVVGHEPDSLPAVAAPIPFPTGIAVDASGDLFVSSNLRADVFKVNDSGQLFLVAGNGTEGYNGDGGPATSSALFFPQRVAVDSSGNIFVADTYNQRIRRIDGATGRITTVAGNGARGYSGDGGPATSAELNYPTGVAVDSSGNVFIADTFNNRVRRVNSVTGVITTVAGNGTADFFGDGFIATGAALNSPDAVAVDSTGNLFIADTSNGRIRRVSAATGVITTVAGSGWSGFSGDGGPATMARFNIPRGVAVDGSGNVFIADMANHRVRRVDGVTNIITTVAGNGTYGFSGDGGPATDATLYYPVSVAVDGSGNFFVADSSNNRIRRVNSSTAVITTVAGNGTSGFAGDGGPAANGVLHVPSGAALDSSSNLFIADAANNSIRRVDATTGVITSLAGNGNLGFSGDGGPAASALLSFPHAVATDGSGNVFIADTSNQRIRRVAAATGVITTIAGNGAGGFNGDGIPAAIATLFFPEGVSIDSSGNIFVADSFNNRIRRIDCVTGVITTVAGNGTAGFAGDGGPATMAMLNYPEAIAVDSDGNLFIADTENNRIRKVDGATGVITTVAGNGNPAYGGDGGPATAAAIQWPTGITVDVDGNLFVPDTRNNRIRSVDAATGVITTIAGNGMAGFGGDGGAATDALLDHPGGVVLNPCGGFFIVDSDGHRIRVVIP